jgi:hypothetical protein
MDTEKKRKLEQINAELEQNISRVLEQVERAMARALDESGIKPPKKETLSWWHLDDKHWANSHPGHYVIASSASGDYWNVDHQHGSQGSWRQHLGIAATVEQAKAIAQADYSLAILIKKEISND